MIEGASIAITKVRLPPLSSHTLTKSIPKPTVQLHPRTPNLTTQPNPTQPKPQGLDVVRPMILSDFEPCFQVSAHRYRYNAALSYSIIRRGEAAAATAAGALPSSSSSSSVMLEEEGEGASSDGVGRVLREGPWEVFAHDSRLPGSGWAFLESRVRTRGRCLSVRLYDVFDRMHVHDA